jgi:NADPH-dependent curcumin reductase CurA
MLVRRLQLRGFLLRDHMSRRQAFLDYAVPAIAAGRLAFREDVTQGLENTPTAFARLLTGRSFGKGLVRL